jgi:hypothetical protein
MLLSNSIFTIPFPVSSVASSSLLQEIINTDRVSITAKLYIDFMIDSNNEVIGDPRQLSMGFLLK